MGLRRESYSDRKGKTAGHFFFPEHSTCTHSVVSAFYLILILSTTPFPLSLPSPSLFLFCLLHTLSFSCLFCHHNKLRFNKVQEYKAAAEESAETFLTCYEHCLEVSTMFSPWPMINQLFQFSPRPAGFTSRSSPLCTGYPSFCLLMTFQQSVILQSWSLYFIARPANNM